MQEITTLTWGDIYQRKMEEMTWERAYEQAVLQEEAEHRRRQRRGWRKLLRPDDVVKVLTGELRNELNTQQSYPSFPLSRFIFHLGKHFPFQFYL